jgi:hypothetical protein
MKLKDVTQEAFDEAIRECAQADGVSAILDIPGVWEIIAEYYNNSAIDRLHCDEDDSDEAGDSDEEEKK